MGALTLKNFPFILRSWNVKSYDSIDPTDSFGQETKIYVNKNKVVKIEPQLTNNISNPWLTDKGRQFFDGIFINFANKKSLNKTYAKTRNTWSVIFSNLQKTLYIFEICNFKNVNKFYYFIVFENLNIENLSFLSLIAQTHSFIRVKRAENVKINNDLETEFQINSATSSSDLASSSLCLLVGTNTRNEGSYLNLKLRQRYFKGNFKFITVGSFLNLTFPVSSLGSNVSALKLVVGGSLTVCQDIANASNSILITNSEVFKKNGSFELFKSLKTLKQANILSKIWNGYNVLNFSLYETGLQNLGQFSFFLLRDLFSFSSLHIINVNLNNVANFKKVLESRIINHKTSNVLENSKLVLNQNFNSASMRFTKSNFLYLPNNFFFDFQETFINTEGLIKRTTKLITRKNVKTDWQLLRKFVQILDSNSFLNNSKTTATICYNNNTLFDFKNFIGFQFHASKNLTNLNFHLIDKTQKFSIYKKFNRFKVSTIKLFDTKLKYWLDDFYTGGKDKFCQNSLILTRCSTNYKLIFSNFF